MPNKKPLSVLQDGQMLLYLDSPNATALRIEVARFAELVKSPGNIEYYRISPISLWSAASMNVPLPQITQVLLEYSDPEPPPAFMDSLKETYGRYGKLKLEKVGDRLELYSADKRLMESIANNTKISGFIERKDETGTLATLVVKEEHRGHIKQEIMARFQYPVVDLAGYATGEVLEERITLLERSRTYGEHFSLWPFQHDAAEVFYKSGNVGGGSGIVVVPCGAGKTIIGLKVMEYLQCHTLILVNDSVALEQWKAQLPDKTSISPDMIGEYSGRRKDVKPVTIATYDVVTHKKKGDYPHFKIFDANQWGLIIYDEVHLLPAPIVRKTAEIQATRRLGLTATLVREDGLEGDIFTLVGPKKFDIPWKLLEEQGYIAQVAFGEIRVPLDSEQRLRYDAAPKRDCFHLAAGNPRKKDVLSEILEYHQGDSILVIGYFLDQLEEISKHFQIPLLSGETTTSERIKWYKRFKSGEADVLALSNVGNFAVDLPNANVMVEVSGTFGSRQEEAQRAGRIFRPKKGDNKGQFYAVVSDGTVEVDFSRNRQRFLAEQGYSYSLGRSFAEVRPLMGLPEKATSRPLEERITNSPPVSIGEAAAVPKPHYNDPALTASAQPSRKVSVPKPPYHEPILAAPTRPNPDISVPKPQYHKPTDIYERQKRTSPPSYLPEKKQEKKAPEPKDSPLADRFRQEDEARTNQSLEIFLNDISTKSVRQKLRNIVSGGSQGPVSERDLRQILSLDQLSRFSGILKDLNISLE